MSQMKQHQCPSIHKWSGTQCIRSKGHDGHCQNRSERGAATGTITYAILSPNSREVVEALIEHVKMLREEVNRLGGKVPAFHPQHIKHDRSNT